MDSGIYFEKFLTEDDFQYFLRLALNEDVMVMNYGRIFTLEEAKKVYKGLLEKNKIHQDFGQFKVFEATTNNFIGLCGLIISDDFTKAEIEYLLLPEYWRKGYGSEIAKVLLKKAEESKSIKKVTATIDPNNIGSRKILLKNRFVSYKTYTIDDGSLAEDFSKEIVF
jgi:ribosomal-protein-alanine N-acetyltransferase